MPSPVAPGLTAALGEIIKNRDALGRVAKWATELMKHHITYVPRTAIKSQVLADFVAERTETRTLPPLSYAQYWMMYFDGSILSTGEGAGIIFISPSGDRLRYAIRLHFPASNNMAEYEALIHGLRIAFDLGTRSLYVRGDSRLVIDQVMIDATCRNNKMVAYCDEVRKLKERLDDIELHHVLWHDNEAADFLAKLASSKGQAPPGIFINNAYEPSIKRDLLDNTMGGWAELDHAAIATSDPSPGSNWRTRSYRSGSEGRDDRDGLGHSHLRLPRKRDPPSQILCRGRGCPLQEKHITNSAEMHPTRARLADAPRNPRRHLRPPCGTKITGQESLSSGILPADRSR
jgi:ribonuclease HI